MGVLRRTCLLLRADFFAFRFVSDFRRRQPIATIQEFFSDGSSETKWPSPPKRNALPKRAGKPPEGSRRNLRDTGEKKCQESRHGQRQKNLRATGRAPVLHAEFPHPFCASGPADRGVDQAVRFYRSRPVRREASGARCEPTTGDVRSAQAQLTAGRAGCQHPGNIRSLPADRRPVPHRNRSPAGNCGPAHCHRQVPAPRQFFPCFFP